MMTPLDKLKSLPDAAAFLKPGVSFEDLDAVAAISDDDADRALNQARQQLFQSITKTRRSAA